MARAGVGRLILIDRDYLESSNLQRQWLYTKKPTFNSGLPKAAAAAAHIRAINSACEVERTHRRSHSLERGRVVGRRYDLILDGCDNFETRYFINDYTVSRGDPLGLRRRGGKLRNRDAGSAW